jgi:energy-coupling factor transport system permease protein
VIADPPTSPGAGLHPLIIAVLALPALVAILVAGRPWFVLTAIVGSLVLTFVRSPRTGAVATLAAAGLGAVVWVGLRLWLPAEAATSGTLRIIGTGALLTVPMLFVDARVATETLIDRFRVPYRVIDAALLGGRFAALLRQDLRMARGLTALRSQGRPVLRARIRAQAALAVLIAAVRHGDELAIAMDARGFGLHPRRTVRCSRPITAVDLGVLAAVWTVSIGLAVVLDRL